MLMDARKNAQRKPKKVAISTLQMAEEEYHDLVKANIELRKEIKAVEHDAAEMQARAQRRKHTLEHELEKARAELARLEGHLHVLDAKALGLVVAVPNNNVENLSHHATRPTSGARPASQSALPALALAHA